MVQSSTSSTNNNYSTQAEAEKMTFKDYLETQEIDNSTPAPEAYVYAAIAAMRPDITYREASLVFADLPVISDAFEALWYGYEDALDRQNYYREHSEPEPVAVITGHVLEQLRQRYR